MGPIVGTFDSLARRPYNGMEFTPPLTIVPKRFLGMISNQGGRIRARMEPAGNRPGGLSMVFFTKPAARHGPALVFLATLLAMVVSCFGAPAAWAEAQAPADGLFVTVPNPITDVTVTEIRDKID